jgi:NTP pyrophosphatase (non-canonical NTP hydrolase)
MTFDLKQIAKECDDIAAANGFERPDWDNIVAKLAFTITELDEARDGARGQGADPLPEELADVAIRLLSALHGMWGDNWGDRVTHRHPKPIDTWTPVEVLLWPILGNICKAIEARRHDARSRVCQWIELALLETFRLADALGIDLNAEVVAKCEKNRGRGHLHGKAYAAG